MEIEYEGMIVVTEDFSVEVTGILPAESYMAKRNTGWQLLTCLQVSPKGYVIPKENAYPYDLWECFKVKTIKDLETIP